MARAALVASALLAEQDSDGSFLRTKVLTARFYADHVLSRADGLTHAVISGSDAALAIDDHEL